jgi:hypothetical protein
MKRPIISLSSNRGLVALIILVNGVTARASADQTRVIPLDGWAVLIVARLSRREEISPDV